MSTFGRHLLSMKTTDEGILRLRSDCLEELGKSRLISIRHPRQIRKRIIHAGGDLDMIRNLTRACQGFTVPPKESTPEYFGRWILEYWGDDPAILEFRDQLAVHDSMYTRRSNAKTCRSYVNIDDPTFQSAVDTFNTLRRIHTAKIATGAFLIDVPEQYTPKTDE